MPYREPPMRRDALRVPRPSLLGRAVTWAWGYALFCTVAYLLGRAADALPGVR